MRNANKVINNIFWRFLERIGAQLVSFIVSIILARILEPSVYGSIALVNILIVFLNVFIDSGFGTALIQKKEVDNLDYSSVFFFNIFISVILYIILFLFAPIISNFYKMELTKVIRCLGIILLISGVKNVQVAYVSRNMIFKKFFVATISGTVFAAVIGILLAYKGFGIWALVFQSLINNFIDTVILFIIIDWRPAFIFSIKRIKLLFSFGWKLLLSSIINVFYSNLQQLIIGKKYSSYDLAYYNKGENFPNLIVSNINTSIDNVLLPVLSESQEDINSLRNMTRKAIKVSSYIIFPLMMGLACCAETVICLLLTDKWLFSIPYLRIFCFTYAFYPIHTANLNAINALGRSDVFLKVEIIKKILGVIVIIITMQFGVIYMAYGGIFICIISQIVNSSPNRKFLNYSFLEQLKDIFPPLLCSIIMGFFVYLENFINTNNLIKLILQIATGAVCYLGISFLFKLSSFNYIVTIIKQRKGSNTNG